VIGALGLAALVGSGRLGSNPVFVPFLLVAAVGFFVAASRLELGVAMLPMVGAFVPFSVGTGTQTALVAAFLFAGLLIALWIVRAVMARNLTLIASPINAPALALMAVWVLAYLYSNAVRPPLVQVWATFPMAQIGGLALVVVSAGVMLLAANAGRQMALIRLSTWGIIGAGCLGVVVFYFHLDHLVPFLNTGGLFTMWVVALAYSQALFNERLPWWARVGLVGLAVAYVVKAMIFQTFWFSGWAPSLVALAAITLFRSRLIFFIMLLGAGLVFLVGHEQIYQAVVVSAQDKGDMTRLDIWQQQLSLIQQYPVLGTGPAGYAVYNVNLFANSQFSMSTHSNYLDVLAQTGVVGVIVFAWLLLAILVVGLRACLRWRSGFAGGYAVGAFGGFCGVLFSMGLGDWLIPFVYNGTIAAFRHTEHSWVFLGFLATLGATHPDPERN
jgi:O-antigen ligase